MVRGVVCLCISVYVECVRQYNQAHAGERRCPEEKGQGVGEQRPGVRPVGVVAL